MEQVIFQGTRWPWTGRLPLLHKRLLNPAQ